MNLDELQSIRDRERQSDSLQQLRESFYADVGAFIQELRAERERAAEHADDPFDDPEVNRLTDDINTAEQTVEAIYERRVGKLVKMASFAAADMPTEDEGLTAEERDLFEDLVASIEDNRRQVFAVLDDESPAPDSEGTTADTRPTDPAETTTEDRSVASDAADGVEAADLMGDGPDGTRPARPATAEAATPTDDPDGAGRQIPPDQPEEATDAVESDANPGRELGDGDSDAPDSRGSIGGAVDTTADEQATDSRQSERSTAGDAADGAEEGGDAAVDRTTVRITRDVGEILGVDQRAYDLSREDVVTLPAANAEPLVEQDAAEPLD